jgi:hypothetical protein
LVGAVARDLELLAGAAMCPLADAGDLHAAVVNLFAGIILRRHPFQAERERSADCGVIEVENELVGHGG